MYIKEQKNMITYKRIKDDETALALYYENMGNVVRYEIDIENYKKFPGLRWSNKHKSLVVTGNMTIAIYIATNGTGLGRNSFVYYKDGNKLNLRQSNLIIIVKNQYITMDDITKIIIIPSTKYITAPIVTLVDTKFVPILQKYQWGINGTGYVYTSNYNQITSSITLHRLIVELREPLISGKEVDHFDNNPLNNQSNNLRQITPLQNKRNRLYKHSRYGNTPGVYLCGGNRWRAESPDPLIAGKVRIKYFSISKFGFTEAFIMALNLRKQWEIELGIKVSVR